MEKNQKIAAIDIGSNAIRATFAKLNETKRELSFTYNKRYPVRLGEDVFSNSRISAKKSDELVEAIVDIFNYASINQIDDIKVVATSALRDAKNSHVILNKIKSYTGLPIDIISGREEAYLITEGIKSFYQNKLSLNRDALFFDIGGGSTEVCLLKKGKLVSLNSIDLGTVRSIQYLSYSEFQLKMSELQRGLYVNLKKHNVSPKVIVGTGGNLRRIGKIRSILHGGTTAKVTIKELLEIHSDVNIMNVDERMKKLKMAKDRADVIVPALDITLRLLQQTKLNQIYLPRVGLKEGVVINQCPVKPRKVHFQIKGQ